MYYIEDKLTKGKEPSRRHTNQRPAHSDTPESHKHYPGSLCTNEEDLVQALCLLRDLLMLI